MADCTPERKAQGGQRELPFQVAEGLPPFPDLKMENFLAISFLVECLTPSFNWPSGAHD